MKQAIGGEELQRVAGLPTSDLKRGGGGPPRVPLRTLLQEGTSSLETELMFSLFCSVLGSLLWASRPRGRSPDLGTILLFLP